MHQKFRILLRGGGSSTVDATLDSLTQSETATYLVNTTITDTGDISVTNYSNYKYLVIIIKGDSNNGMAYTIPKALYGVVQFPLYMSSKNNAAYNDGTGYCATFHGYFINGVITCNYLQFSGWDGVQIIVFGVS